LSKYVDVYASDKDEKFIVERLNDSETRVSIYKIGKEGEAKHQMYQRTFYRKQTKEVRLYGLDGNDAFVISGNTKKGIKVRVIGGEANDTITDQSNVAGITKRTIVYDNLDGNQFNLNSETNRQMSKSPAINNPDLDKFFYNYLGPEATLFYNIDDGLFFGTGFLYKKYKFRRLPYSAQHKLVVSAASSTGSVKIDYEGDVKNLFYGMDLGIKFLAYTPAFVINYFGYGNESKNMDQPIAYNRVRLNKIIFNPSFNKNLTSFFTVGIGPKFEHYRIEKNPDVYIDSTLALTEENFYSERQYGGIRSFFSLGTKDSRVNPKRGLIWTAEGNWMKKPDRFHLLHFSQPALSADFCGKDRSRTELWKFSVLPGKYPGDDRSFKRV
jgi:hypothetical protein